MTSRLLTLTLALPLLTAAACAQQAVPSYDKEQMSAIVRDILISEPEIVRDALEELDRKEQEKAMEAIRPMIYNNPGDPTLGPKNAKVTIVEFFDYNCGFCKTSTDWVADVLKKHPKDVRVIFKEIPLLDRRTGTSRYAALAALAADRQGKYEQMHFRLMAERSLSEERIDAVAKDIGLDMDQYRRDMDDDKLADVIEDNFMIVRQLPNFGGTPFFLIGDGYVAGADEEKLDELLAEALN